jgi:predicted nucleic acid-binding protein
MKPNTGQIALVDSGYWYALLDERDPHHSKAAVMAESLLRFKYLIPWPVMYETLCTRFVRRPLAVRQFESFLKRPNAVTVDDARYRDAALAAALDTAKPHPNMLSAVDCVLRLILDDPAVRVRCMFTFNPGDFQDVCFRRRVEIA